jgi:hypothetical protein
VKRRVAAKLAAMGTLPARQTAASRPRQGGLAPGPAVQGEPEAVHRAATERRPEVPGAGERGATRRWMTVGRPDARLPRRAALVAVLQAAHEEETTLQVREVE